jgi:hypothetical protein
MAEKVFTAPVITRVNQKSYKLTSNRKPRNFTLHDAIDHSRDKYLTFIMEGKDDDVTELFEDLYGNQSGRARSAGPRASGSVLGGPLAVKVGPAVMPDAFVSRRASLTRPPARPMSGPHGFTGDAVTATLRRGHNAAVFDAALRKSHVQKLPPHEQLDATRDARILDRWERQQAQWADFKAATAMKLRRGEDELVMSQSESFRSVREELALIDKATPKDEVTAPADWMSTLRDSGSCSLLRLALNSCSMVCPRHG